MQSVRTGKCWCFHGECTHIRGGDGTHIGAKTVGVSRGAHRRSRRRISQRQLLQAYSGTTQGAQHHCIERGRKEQGRPGKSGARPLAFCLACPAGGSAVLHLPALVLPCLTLQAHTTTGTTANNTRLEAACS